MIMKSLLVHPLSAELLLYAGNRENLSSLVYVVVDVVGCMYLDPGIHVTTITTSAPSSACIATDIAVLIMYLIHTSSCVVTINMILVVICLVTSATLVIVNCLTTNTILVANKWLVTSTTHVIINCLITTLISRLLSRNCHIRS